MTDRETPPVPNPGSAPAGFDSPPESDGHDPFGLVRGMPPQNPETEVRDNTTAMLADIIDLRGISMTVDILAADTADGGPLAGCVMPGWFITTLRTSNQGPYRVHLGKTGQWSGMISLDRDGGPEAAITFAVTLMGNDEPGGETRQIAFLYRSPGRLTLCDVKTGHLFTQEIATGGRTMEIARRILKTLLAYVAGVVAGPVRPEPQAPSTLAPEPADVPPVAPITIEITREAEPKRRMVPIYAYDELIKACDDLPPNEDGQDEDGPNNAVPREIFDGDRDQMLRGLVKKGPEGALRELRVATPDNRAAVVALGARAPHLDGLTQLIVRQVDFSINTGLPIRLPPVLLLDKPGTGKTWYLSRLARALGLPYVRQPMTGVSLSEGFQGGHPNWRNARHGLVAQALLKEAVANPLFFIDEFDKPQINSFMSDPYRPFYALHEREGAADFVDEFLRFPLNARHILWTMAANSLEPFPEPILQRLTVIRIPEITPAQMRIIAASIYRECNALNEDWFAPEIPEAVCETLITRVPREVRKAIDEAMIQAGAENRREIQLSDLPALAAERNRYGFT